MSQADELLNGLTSDEIAAYTANSETEPHIVVDANRVITVPDELRRIAVQHDHNIETVTFDCPRYWDENDLSSMNVYINYMRADGKRGQYKATRVTPDADDPTLFHFDWTISKNLTLVNGSVMFLVCAKTTDLDGHEISHWNSELNEEMYVSEGLELGDAIVEENPDIITQLLTRMDETEYLVGMSDVMTAAKYYEDAKAEHQQVIEDIAKANERIDELMNKDVTQEYVETQLSDGSEYGFANGYIASNGVNAVLVITSIKQEVASNDIESTIFSIPTELFPLNRIESRIDSDVKMPTLEYGLAEYNTTADADISYSNDGITFVKSSDLGDVNVDVFSKTKLTGKYLLRVYSYDTLDSGMGSATRFVVGGKELDPKNFYPFGEEVEFDNEALGVRLVGDVDGGASVSVGFDLLEISEGNVKLIIDEDCISIVGEGIIHSNNPIYIPYPLKTVSIQSSSTGGGSGSGTGTGGFQMTVEGERLIFS